MENEDQNFDQLKKLLALKKHELPPPGYFNKLPGEVISRIRVERAASVNPMATLKSEAPWVVRLWQSLEAKPAFAGVFGAAICAVVLAAIFFAEKPTTQPTFAGPRTPAAAPFVAATPAIASGTLDQPVLLAGTNQNGVNLFEQIPSLQTVPASVNP
jgi:hypothetical protein